jgi:YegS/Rv2252/BmrU family lipid kinase
MKLKPILMDVIQIFNEADYNVDVKITQRRGHATEMAKNLSDDVDIVVVSGGDGTLNEVLTGLIQSNKKLPIGYIPAGSTNDFATTLGITSDPKKAAMQIVSGKPMDIDVGKFSNDRYFSYISSFGVFTAVSYNTPQSFKNIFGHLAYVLEGAKDLTKITAYNVKLETEDCVYEGKYIFGAVSNTTSVGGILKLDKDMVKMNDGLFEIVLVKRPNNINDLRKIIMGCTKADFSSDVFEFSKTKTAKFTFENPMDWSVDGEHESTGTEAVIDNLEKSAIIIV